MYILVSVHSGKRGVNYRDERSSKRSLSTKFSLGRVSRILPLNRELHHRVQQARDDNGPLAGNANPRQCTISNESLVRDLNIVQAHSLDLSRGQNAIEVVPIPATVKIVPAAGLQGLETTLSLMRINLVNRS